MQVPLLIFVFVTVLVNMSFGRSCDTKKFNSCMTKLTSDTNDKSIHQNKTKSCIVYQTYAHCVLKQTCNGLSLPDRVKNVMRQIQRQYGQNCRNGGAASMSSPLRVVTSFFAAVGVFFALSF